MDNKDKIIKEMAKDLNEIETDVGHILVNETFSYVKEHKKYNPKKDFFNAHTKTFEELTAEEMIKKGYQKVNKDSIVLSREEYTNYMVEYMGVKEIKERVSKETAEKFANELKQRVKCLTGKFDDEGFWLDIQAILRNIDFVAEQFGVKIKE